MSETTADKSVEEDVTEPTTVEEDQTKVVTEEVEHVEETPDAVNERASSEDVADITASEEAVTEPAVEPADSGEPVVSDNVTEEIRSQEANQISEVEAVTPPEEVTAIDQPSEALAEDQVTDTRAAEAEVPASTDVSTSSVVPAADIAVGGAAVATVVATVIHQRVLHCVISYFKSTICTN